MKRKTKLKRQKKRIIIFQKMNLLKSKGKPDTLLQQEIIIIIQFKTFSNNPFNNNQINNINIYTNRQYNNNIKNDFNNNINSHSFYQNKNQNYFQYNN